MSVKSSDRKRRISLIHVAKKQLGLGEEEYRSLLYGVTGKTSCSECTDEELVLVTRALEKAGFVKEIRVRGGGTREVKLSPQQRVIFALWYRLHELGQCDGTTEGLNRFIRQQTMAVTEGIGIERIEFCTKRDYCYPVIEGLKKWLDKVKQQERPN